MIAKPTCKTCRFFKPLRYDDSGVPNPGGNGNWQYVVGECTNAESPHFTDAERLRLRLLSPEWGNCYCHKSKTKGAQ